MNRINFICIPRNPRRPNTAPSPPSPDMLPAKTFIRRSLNLLTAMMTKPQLPNHFPKTILVN